MEVRCTQCTGQTAWTLLRVRPFPSVGYLAEDHGRRSQGNIWRTRPWHTLPWPGSGL